MKPSCDLFQHIQAPEVGWHFVTKGFARRSGWKVCVAFGPRLLWLLMSSLQYWIWWLRLIFRFQKLRNALRNVLLRFCIFTSDSLQNRWWPLK